ncbi:MAG: hypothetical protein KJ737_21665 [Proteobacteria bacterium]|nr:hypothetical protein [Pseudomonadota bacterium]
MKSKHAISIGTLFLFTMILMVSLSYLPNLSFACDIAVVSGQYTSNGRPLIWKNRDHGPRWEQEVRYYEALDPSVGGSVRVVDRSSLMPAIYPDGSVEILSGGVNASGFAITNTTVYENDPIHEYYSNANHLLMEEAIETCKTVEDFDDILANFREVSKNWDKIISGNFVVIDAEGGAALYEIFSGNGFQAYLNPLMINKFDANDPEDAPYGFVNRTNSHEWIPRDSDTQRELRGADILLELYDEGIEYPDDAYKGLNFKNVLMVLAKDVCGDDPDMVNGIPATNPNKYYDYYCISRAMTNIALVVDGVAPGENQDLATLWCNLGEPSIGVSTPHFPAALAVTPYAWAEAGMETGTPTDDTVTCAMNQAINDQEIDGLYINNWDYGNPFIQMDRTIDYELLRDVQEWTLPLETKIIMNTETILDRYRKGDSFTTEDLYDLSHYAARFMYNNYTNQSDDYFLWDFGGVLDDVDTTVDDDTDSNPSDDDVDNVDPDANDGSTGLFSFTRFMIWLLSIFANF